ncbi:MAG: Gfo/Idh/MocA family oxidoreductase [bacterium]
MINYAITGVAGYIAPRHLKAITDTGCNLVAAVDPHDSVGILDQYFPACAFFTETERFDRHLDKLRRTLPQDKIDFLSVCSPNHLHDSHVRLGLRLGADVICEKPIVLNPWNLEALRELEKEYGKRVYTVLQLRVHPALVKLKQELAALKQTTKHKVSLTYVASRGPWYKFSWKGNISKSGGVATNIGVHFFDLLIWLFGKVKTSQVHLSFEDKIAGFIELENAEVDWFLSIDRNDLPIDLINNNSSTYRSIKLDNNEIEFTGGFTNLHTKIYSEVLSGHGFGIDDSFPSIELVHNIRGSQITLSPDTIHPLAKKIISH